MIKSNRSSTIRDLLIGIVGSLVASFIVFLSQKLSTHAWALTTLTFIVNLGLFLYYRQHYQSAASKLETLKSLTGLIDIDSSLREGETPQKCMAKTTNSLKFMGIGAQKWSSHEEDLRHMLSRLSRVRGTARFLILDPHSPVAAQTSLRTGHKSDWLCERLIASLRQFKVLRDRGFDNLEVRLYSHYPCYRLVIVNDRIAIVGQYRGVDTTTGWEAPLVHFENDGVWSFYQGYHVHFDSEWEVAKPVEWDSLL